MFAKSLLLVGAFSIAIPAAVAADAPAKDDALPRYRFQPGQKLTFLSASSFQHGEGEDAGSLDDRSEWTVWVLRANADGSFRLVLRERSSFAQTLGKSKHEQPPRTHIVYADVFPDGRVLSNPMIQYQGHPGTLFPPLPKDWAEAKAGWQARNGDDRVVCKLVESKENFRFHAATESPLDKIYLSSTAATYTFAPARNLVMRADTLTTQGYGFKGAGKGTLELKDVKSLSPDVFGQFAKAADGYFAAVKSYEDLTKAASAAPPAQARDLLAKAQARLKAAAAAVRQDDFRADLADRAKRHDANAKYLLEEAERRAKFLGQPASEFATTDLDGKKVQLADLRGKVVILDFWYRGCGWCVKAMPQMNRLAADFSGQPVVIFGMNTDQKEEDARFVVEKMELKYANLKAEGLPEKFGVRGFPTLVVIDQQGKIHDIHVGYSPTLRAEIGNVIRRLLAK